MPYREQLPEGCPPNEAEEITTRRIVYRLVSSNPPTYDDFRSQRALKPDHDFRNATECQARGLSVFADRRAAEERLKRRNMRGKMVCEVALDRGSGRIQKTGGSHHYTWWPLADFDILSNCRVVAS